MEGHSGQPQRVHRRGLVEGRSGGQPLRGIGGGVVGHSGQPQRVHRGGLVEGRSGGQPLRGIGGGT